MGVVSSSAQLQHDAAQQVPAALLNELTSSPDNQCLTAAQQLPATPEDSLAAVCNAYGRLLVCPVAAFVCVKAASLLPVRIYWSQAGHSGPVQGCPGDAACS